MKLILRQNIGKSFKPCFNFDWSLLIGTSRSVTHHAFLVEAGVDLKSLIPIEMSSLFRLFHTFFNTFFFLFSCFFKYDCFNINFIWVIGKEGSVNSWGQCQHHVFTTLIWPSGRLFCECQLFINQENTQRNFYANWYPKWTFLPMTFLSDAFIQTTNKPKKPLDLMPCEWSKYCVRSYTSISISNS